GMGQRATGTGTATFQDIAVSADEVLEFAPPNADDEEQALYLSGAFFQLYVTALEVGVLHALRDDAVAHVLQRPRSFAWAPNPTAADDPLLQREIGEIAAAAYAGQATVLAAADALDRHWRNIRTLASHNPASYKAQALGALHVRGTRLPGSGYF
ncbi:acyl-CoA dehydrogenase, partial [Mycolicibacterium peregrinum]